MQYRNEEARRQEPKVIAISATQQADALLPAWGLGLVGLAYLLFSLTL